MHKIKTLVWLLVNLLILISFNSWSQNHIIDYIHDITKGEFSISINKSPAKIIPDPLHNVNPIMGFDYSLSFGKLEKLKGFTFYSALTTMTFASINEMVENLYGPINLKYKDIPVNKGFMRINLYKYVFTLHNEVFYKQLFREFKLEIKENLVLDTYISNKIVENLDSLDLIGISIYKEEEGQPIAYFNIGIYGSKFHLGEGNELLYCYSEKNKWTRIVPISLSTRHFSKDYNHSTEPQYYQLVNTNDKQIIRTDTTYIPLKSFLNYYRTKSNTEVIHLTGFRSKDRLINFKRDWGQCDTCVNKSELAKLGESEFMRLYEYCPLVDTVIKVYVGDLLSDWKYKLYDKSWFLKNAEKGLNIKLPEGDFTPIYMEFIVFDDNGDKQFVSTDDIKNEKLKSVWDQLPDLAGMYIQNIVFQDKAGRKTRIPNTFIYYISK